ncbi:hypothetical protein [Emticicia sp. 17c]|uniref:hypothetical protein n=1 Tax=Emticicia sp. 17c TaxID=3127704 RepID=UPI00301CE468
MKNLFLGTAFITLLGLSACEKPDEAAPATNSIKAESILDFACLYNSADVPLKVSDAKKNIYGLWQLKGTITMSPPAEEVPNLKIAISAVSENKNLAEIYENDKKKYSVNFSLVQKEYEKHLWVEIVPEKETLDDGTYNFIKGTIRICEGELMIDNGMAFDAPAFLFRKTQ